MLVYPSYKNGFAPRDGMPLYPALQRGLVGGWSPQLGQTGAVLRDISGRGNHGTLANMVLDTDWVNSHGQYALNMDGADSLVECTTLSCFDLGPLSIACWLYVRTSTTSDVVIATTDVGNMTLDIGSGTNRRLRFTRDWVVADISATWNTSFGLSAWTPIVLTWTGGSTASSALKLYSGGEVLTQSATTNGNTYLSPGLSPVFRIGSATVPMDGLIDDIRIYGRVLTHNEAKILALRRGIANELAPRRRSQAQVVGGSNRRRRLLIGS